MAGVARSARIIEVGPSFNPIAPRSDGWRTTIVDHDDRAGLIKKYATADVDPSRIEDVDIIWQGGRLEDQFPKSDHGAYDALIASHVVEHLPDPLGFLESCASLLDPEHGVLLLALPDKRWCFDVFRSPSLTGDWLEARAAERTRHTRRAVFNDVAYATHLSGRIGWGREPTQALQMFHPFHRAVHLWSEHDERPSAPYRDAHGWQFTPSSFELIILESAAGGWSDWRIDWVDPQPMVEFTARLRRGRAAFASEADLDAARLELLRRIWLELREQTDWLVAPGGPAGSSP